MNLATAHPDTKAAQIIIQHAQRTDTSLIELFLRERAKKKAMAREGIDGLYRLSDFRELHEWQETGCLSKAVQAEYENSLTNKFKNKDT